MATSATPNDDTDQPSGTGYSHHFEPLAQGGEEYVECNGCGREAVPANPENVTHADDCPNANGGA